VDAALDSLGIGLWFGLTAPLAIHIAVVIITKNQATALSRIVRFIAVPVALFGILGIAGVLGQRPESAIWSALGLFFGGGVYVVCAWLHYRHVKSKLSATNGT
jgi:hypothetical protein